jgi:hypothetical protein
VLGGSGSIAAIRKGGYRSRMSRARGHLASYHRWPSSTPVIDAIRSIVAAASVVIGAHAVLFLMFAVRHHDRASVIGNGALLVVIALGNAAVDAVRHWRRHHA